MLQKLQELRINPGCTILFAGIGNVLRSDDGAGVYICKKIRPSATCIVLIVETSIENYIGKINRSGAGVLVLADCVDFGKNPGHFDLVAADELMDLTFHTHNISLKKISELFRMPAWILGIQPEDTSFGEDLTGTVRKAAETIIRMINSICVQSR